jgi:ankyrin repeat protein
MVASQGGYTDIVKKLVETGANVNYVNKNGKTALMSTVNINIVKYLIASGADIDATDIFGDTALIWAVVYGRPEEIKTLIEANANLNKIDMNGWTALSYANFLETIDIINILEDSKAK